MPRRSPRVRLPLLALALALEAACGKRADPLAPYVKTPQPPSAVEVAQSGDDVEIRVVAPRVTTENRPLPVIELEWSQAPALGDFGKLATSLLREEVAPGEVRVKRFPRPETEVRYSVRAFSRKARSTLPAPVPFKPAPVPPVPTGVQALNTATGVELRWINPPGAEPWPTPTPTPSPSPSPSPGLSPGLLATPGGLPPNLATASPEPSPVPPPPAEPTPTPSPSPSPSPQATPSASPSPGPVPSPSPGAVISPTPTPTPTPPPVLLAGLRIFRTDGSPRLARDPIQATTWLDPGVRPGDKPCYSIRYASSLKPLVESAGSEPVCVEVKDIVPPAPPDRVLVDLGSTFVEISWTASSSVDIASYRVYRSVGDGARTLVIETDSLVLRVQDKDLTKGPRIYEVVAVDKGGNESPPATALRIVVP